MCKSIPFLLFILSATFFCCGTPEDTKESFDTAMSHKRAEIRLSEDMTRLQAFSRELEQQAEEMKLLQETVRLKERGYYTSDEHDAIENLLFRYLACRESLWDIVDYYRDYHDRFLEEEDQVRGFILGFDSALHLAYYGSLLVETFIDEDTVIDKLNEEYYRSDIPEGTYDRLLASLTKIENLEALETAWELYSSEMEDTSSPLYKIAQSDPDYSRAAVQISSLYNNSKQQIRNILEKKSLFLPDVRNRLRHSAIVELAQQAQQEIGDNLYAARGILFVNISRIKSPMASNIWFSKEQVARMKKLLKPGDIILTYSSGYMSNIFLPGKFKHGITYVGSPEDRKQLGLTAGMHPELTGDKKNTLKTNLETATLESGYEADLIEAVAEGVIFNSLEEIAREHVARLCVLRPNLDRDTLAASLTNIFILLGDRYDFKFDFVDASMQCCTELIYRCLNKHDPIEFKLKKRMGVWTLSADDITEYYLSSNPGAFDFVLYAEENADSDGNAVIFTGDEGRRRLEKLMGRN